ncbi:MAG: low specificity L-threonine aldolase [Verrucomicrobiales bacterium]|jgi:threonine aldolase|nr:low specificity L-threonine aldolase [Verrucomicrobiales bacterium]MDP6752221.1 GntG family PLP-dependent aldolase [Verrucomicrobiota bacterium]MDP7012889.1 GntG family PLP-dependent aldolase [Verrucomicrobiota bacterium]
MLKGRIDLRSDTITQPDDAMREVMAHAVVGDDVLGDDPTVRELEQRTAALLGKEAAVFVPSGTMANQLAIRSLTRPGDAILLDANAHIYCYEAGAPAALAGVQVSLLDGARGQFTAAQLEAALPPRDDHFAPPSLVCIENTHNRGGGSVWPLEQIESVTAAARGHGLSLHLDGARLWNASAASGVSEAEYASHFDTVSVCFSKGLGAPVGSILAGTADVIANARFYRKQQGGAMRQVGIIAAAARHALEHNRSRLVDDHANGRALANGLAKLPGLEVDAAGVETNMVFIGTGDRDAGALAKRLEELGVRLLDTGPHTLRAVTNLTVSAEEVGQALTAFEQAL